MKRLLLLAALLLGAILPVSAHGYAPLAFYLKASDQVCLAKVTAVEGNKITFAVTKTLQGKPGPILQFQRFADQEAYTLGSEWLLVAYAPGDAGILGWNPEGFCGWVPAAVHHDGDKTYLTRWNNAELTKRLPLETALQFLKNPPAKS